MVAHWWNNRPDHIATEKLPGLTRQTDERNLPWPRADSGLIRLNRRLTNQISRILDSLLHFHPLDLRAETCEFFIKHFVTAIDMIYTVDFRSSVSY